MQMADPVKLVETNQFDKTGENKVKLNQKPFIIEQIQNNFLFRFF